MPYRSPRMCCLDLDTFFVSVERVLDPSLKNKPVVIGGKKGSRGVVTAASYEVRPLGVHSGMPLTEAARLAPHAIFMPGTHGVYSDYAERVRQIAKRYTPCSRVASIDEMFLDFTGCERMYARGRDRDGDATIERVVRSMTATIDRELGLPASAGIASSKPVSKVASALAKPAGVLLVRAGTERDLLAPLPVRAFPGIGPVGERRLTRLGIETLGQVAEAPPQLLHGVFGAWAEAIQKGARGMGSADLGRERPAFREHDPAGLIVGSISNERTFFDTLGDLRRIHAVLCSLTERVCFRARKRGVKARTVTLKLRYSDFQTLSRSRSIRPTHSELELYPVVKRLFQRARQRSRSVRLLGLQLSNLCRHVEQRNLFGIDNRLHAAIDELRSRHGFDVVRLLIGQARSGARRR